MCLDLLGRGEPASLDHARLQPVPDKTPSEKCPESGEKVVVIDSVECRYQVRGAEYPLPVRVAALAGQKDRLDRVVATSARTVG